MPRTTVSLSPSAAPAEATSTPSAVKAVTKPAASAAGPRRVRAALPITSGSSGSTHGESAVSSPATNASASATSPIAHHAPDIAIDAWLKNCAIDWSSLL